MKQPNSSRGREALLDQVKDGRDGSGGITSSLADARHGIGLIENGSSGDPLYRDFGGITLAGGEALLRFTLFGDADLDGAVGGDDLLRARTNLGKAGDWLDGDFDYDGRVSVRDLAMARRNFGLSIPETAGFQSAGAAAVPEPAALVPAAAMAGLRTRRRRRRPGAAASR